MRKISDKDGCVRTIRGLKPARNYFYYKFKKVRFVNVTFVLTDRCNLKCKMCDIWQKAGSQQHRLPVDLVKRVLMNPALHKIKYVNYTGGEPFIRRDLEDILDLTLALFPKNYITISSNGTLGERMKDVFSNYKEKIGQFALKVSVDGLEAAHDEVRQSRGSFQKINKNISMLKRLYSSLDIEVKFVITPWNYHDIEKVTSYCRERNLKLFIKIIENLKVYTNSLYYGKNIKEKKFELNAPQKGEIIHQLERIKNFGFVNSYYIKRLIAFLKGKRNNDKCYVPQKNIFIDSNGAVYTCRKDRELGNVTHKSIEKIIMSEDYLKNYRKLASGEICHTCFYVERFL